MGDVDARFEEWAVVEIMGHRRLAGRVTEERIAGADLLRVDIPAGDAFTTQYYGGSSIFCLTPVTEQVARAAAARNQPEPVHRWELPAVPAAVDLQVEEQIDAMEENHALRRDWTEE